MARAVAGKQTAAPDVLDTLLSLVCTLRSLQLTGRDHPWLALSISMAQVKTLLLLLQTGGLPTRGLADRLGVGASAVTSLVDKLVDQKFVRRDPDPNDRRIIWVRPTAKALALWEKLMEANRAALAEVLDEIPVRERGAMQDCLQRLIDAAGRVAARGQG